MSLDVPSDHEPAAQATDASGGEVDWGLRFEPGNVLGDRYQIRALLGCGGRGEVWHAYDLKLRVEVALKGLRPELLVDGSRRESLRPEVRAAREVVSPNVCRIFDLIEVDGDELVSMEYVDGGTLLEVLQERGPLELKEAQDIASQFLAGLEAIHQAGLVHHDVKPENIMLTPGGAGGDDGLRPRPAGGRGLGIGVGHPGLHGARHPLGAGGQEGGGTRTRSPLQLKFDGIYRFDFGLSTGLSTFYPSGTPMTAMGFSDWYGGWEYYLSERSAFGRTDAEWEADLHFGYPIRLGARLELNLLLDIFNIFNRQGETYRDIAYTDFYEDPVYRPLDWITGVPHEPIEPGDVDRPPTGPTWNAPLFWQDPRKIRLGVRLSF